MSDKRRALGRGLGALIPSSPVAGTRPVDVFFPDPLPEVPALDERDESTEGGEPAGQGPGPEHEVTAEGSVGLRHREAQPGAADPVQDRDSPAQQGGIDARQRVDAEWVPGATGGGPSEKVPTMEVRSEGAAEAVTEHGPAAGASGLAPVPGATFAELPVGAISPNPRQPRTVFDEDDMAELVASVREIGILQPVVVRRSATLGPDVAAYELIMGERRWRASQAAGLTTVPAIIKDTADDDLLRDALLENLHRAQLNPLEEAAAYRQLLDDFGCTQEELATRLSRSRPQVTNTLRLLRLPPLVARRVAAGVLSAGHARALLGLPDGGAMERLAQRIVAEGLSVRSVEEIVAVGDDEDGPVRRRPRAGGRPPRMDDLAARLSDRLDTRVGIAIGQRKGKMTVEFASVDDLHRILGEMNLSTED